ncbi:MAG: M24 family metallopeptidase [Bacteriovoracia bacterium]
MLSNLAVRTSNLIAKGQPIPEFFSFEEIQEIKKLQRLAFDCCVEISKLLKVGWTEVETASLMDQFLRDHGIRNFFHSSFAWFGDRTRFQGFTKPWHFLNTKRRLSENDVIILDTAPIRGYFMADVGYTLSLTPHEGLEKAKQWLRKIRKELPGYFESSMTTAEIWDKVDEEIKLAGFDNVHKIYPFETLAHRVHRLPLTKMPGVLRPFSIQSYLAGFREGLKTVYLGRGHEGSKVGLWAIEPQVGGPGFGAKFEEIIVVEPSGKAYWLDDQVPHMLSEEVLYV